MEEVESGNFTNKLNDIPFIVDQKRKNQALTAEETRNLKKALKAGFVGACTLNLIHESMRMMIPNSPRMDLIAMRAINKGLASMDVQLSYTPLRTIAFAGDLLSNTTYYTGIGELSQKTKYKNVWGWAYIFGLAAGVSAVFMPPLMGLGQQPTKNIKSTAVLTVAWYLLGAFATAKTLESSQ